MVFSGMYMFFCVRIDHIHMLLDETQIFKQISLRIFMDFLVKCWMPILMILENQRMVGRKDGTIPMKIQLPIGYGSRDGMKEMEYLGTSYGSLDLFP